MLITCNLYAMLAITKKQKQKQRNVLLTLIVMSNSFITNYYLFEEAISNYISNCYHWKNHQAGSKNNRPANEILS